MENLIVRANRKVDVDKFISQVKVVTANNIKKILSSTARSDISSCECQNNMTVLGGKIRVEVVYLSQDGNIESAYGEVDFIEKQKSEFDMTSPYAFDKVYVSDVNFSSNEIICYVTHNTQIMGILDYQIPNFESADEMVVADMTSLSTSQFLMTADDNFVVSEDDDSNLKDIEVLKTNAQVVIDEAACSVDKIVIDGRVLVEVIYKDIDSMSSIQKQIEFKQEIAAVNVSPNMKVSAFSNIKSATCSLMQTENKNYLSYSIEIAAKCYVFEEKNISVARDMFMLSNETKVVYDCIETKNALEVIPQSESFVSQTNITDIADFDDIIGVFEPEIKLLTIENQENKAIISADVFAYALYKDSQGASRLDINKNISFEVQLSDDKIVESAKLDCQILSFKVKAGKEIEVVIKANCIAIASSSSLTTCVKSFEILDEKLDLNGGIKVLVVRENQSLFDIAKSLNVNQILLLNKMISTIFSRLDKKFMFILQ